MVHREISGCTIAGILGVDELLLSVNPAEVTMLTVPPYRLHCPSVRVLEVGPEQLPARVISQLPQKGAAGISVTVEHHY